MKKLWFLFALCLLLTACGAASSEKTPEEPAGALPAEVPETSDSGVIFTYNGKNYDLQEREPGETQAGTFLVVEGHINPKIAYYGIFDTEAEAFVKDILGTHLTWREDDITTAAYDVWSDSCIYGYDGQLLAQLDLAESQYVYSLNWTDSRHLSVDITSDTSDELTTLDLEVSAS